MSSTTLSHKHYLPPTSNTLNSQQRTRLVRSTRKLGAVLGTTPYLLENDTSYTILPLGKTTPRALKRQGSIFTHHQSSSLSVASGSTSTSASSHRPSPSVPAVLPYSAPGLQSTEAYPQVPPGLPTGRKYRLGDKAPKLYLRLDTVPVSPTDIRFTSSLSPSACSAPPTPITPTIPDPSETRRKRMAKLARHLGEKIPAELVLTPEPDINPPAAPLNCAPRRRSRSVHILHSNPAHISCSKPLQGQGWVGEWNRSNIQDVQRELRNLKLR